MQLFFCCCCFVCFLACKRQNKSFQKCVPPCTLPRNCCLGLEKWPINNAENFRHRQGVGTMTSAALLYNEKKKCKKDMWLKKKCFSILEHGFKKLWQSKKLINIQFDMNFGKSYQRQIVLGQLNWCIYGKTWIGAINMSLGFGGGIKYLCLILCDLLLHQQRWAFVFRNG